MAFQLRVEEIISALQEINHPKARALTVSLEELGNIAVEELCAALDILPGEATFDLGFVAAPIYAKHEGQRLPAVVAHYDNADEWAEPPPTQRLAI